MEFFAKLKKNIKYIKLSDIGSFFIFLFVYPIAFLLRLRFKLQNKKVWLIAESPDTARDNGYHFFKYVTKNHPEISAYYAIEKKCADRLKVASLGRIVNYGSFKHWVLYLSANENISTQKSGNPAPPLFYLLHIYGVIKNNRTFLQHGITKDNMDWLYYSDTRFKLFIAGAKKEYDYIKKTFGYPERAVAYTGFARFDALNQIKLDTKQILVMPTWRNWLGREMNSIGEKINFEDTAYFQRWSSLLKNKRLVRYIEDNGITLYFYPHYNMQKFLHFFKIGSNNMKIVSKEDADIQKLLKESSLLITDYSSIFFDFAFMNKPLMYYQFDENEYREKQYKEGYFSYRRDGFGPVLTNEKDLVDEVVTRIEGGYRLDPEYSRRNERFFVKRDGENSKRIFNAIANLNQRDRV